jgi:hypothetical protein
MGWTASRSSTLADAPRHTSNQMVNLVLGNRIPGNQWKPFHRLRKEKECVRKEKSVDKEKDYMLDHINGIKKTTDKITTSCID